MDFVVERAATGSEIGAAAKRGECIGRSSPLGATTFIRVVSNFSIFFAECFRCGVATL